MSFDLGSVFDLTPPEKLQRVEDLWDDRAATPEAVPIHDWQKVELARRKANLLNNRASGLSWEEVKRRIRSRYGRRIDYRSVSPRLDRRHNLGKGKPMSIVVAPEPVPLSTDADGVVRIGGTRVTLDTLVAAFREGATAETIAEQYPSLPLDRVYTVIGYYLRHRDEVDAYLERRRHIAVQVRQENDTRFPPLGIRARLLARRPPQG